MRQVYQKATASLDGRVVRLRAFRLQHGPAVGNESGSGVGRIPENDDDSVSDTLLRNELSGRVSFVLIGTESEYFDRVRA